MDRVLDWLQAIGYAGTGTDRVRRHRLAIILVAAAVAWAPVLVLAWMMVTLIPS